MEELTEGDKKLISDIKEYGWHIVKIMEEGEYPRFAYSVGLYESFEHPEIIIIGLKFELLHLLINNIGEDIRGGKKYESGEFYPDILDNFECLMLEMKAEHYREYLGYANWFYKRKNKSFPALQCIYPTVRGIYPWEDNCPKEIKNLQPILGDWK